MSEVDTNEITATPFSDILDSSKLLSALDGLGFTSATTVQALSIPPALGGKDLIIEAKTGSGKTLAFGLPLLSLLEQAIQAGPVDYTFSLIIAPTRELAVQISTVLSDLIPEITPTLLIGGMPYPKQKRQLKENPGVVIGTTGRILDLIQQRELDLSNCLYFVLDEADKMFEMGFIEDVERILSDIPLKAQGLFVSATISPRVKMLAEKYLQDAVHVEAAKEDEELPPIDHLFCMVEGGVSDKPRALCDLIETELPESAIIFCNTKSETELVEVFLRRRGFDARRINSDLNQKQRSRVMDKIHAKELRFLVATDIAARGIDVKGIELVVNFSLPDQPESYVHRAGRTGRAGHAGRAISLVSPHDFMAFRGVKGLGLEFSEIKLPSEEEIAKARFKHLQQILNEQKPEIDPRGRALAREIFEQLGSVAEPGVELEEFVALLSQFTVEHFVKADAISLDEELASEKGPGTENRNNGGSGKRRSKRSSKQHRSRRSGRKR